MLFTEYNEEAHINHVKESSYENGYGKGYGNGYDSGIDIMSELYIKLEEQNRLDDYSKAVKNPQFRDELLKEFFPGNAK